MTSHRLQPAGAWQSRPELDRLCDWWRSPAFGVCLLEGIGGCGKSALVDRFLRILPGGYPVLPDVAKEHLPEANLTFVFSFADGSEDAFFTDLAFWLTVTALDGRPSSYDFASAAPGTNVPAPSTTSYRQVLEWLAKAARHHGKVLLVLDGLDRVQDSTPDERTVGCVADSRLQNLLVDAALGVLGAAIVVTSRYPLSDVIRTQGAKYFHRIDIGELSPATSCSLLRARGVVRGSDDQLATLAREHGFHAQSLDLLGGYLGEYCDGDPGHLKDRRGAEGAGTALQSVADHYRRTLADRDPAALALLERLCLFRMGASSSRLAGIFLGKKKLSGAALAKLKDEGLQARLNGLARMHLVLVAEGAGGPFYQVPAALRDVLIAGVDGDAQSSIHKAALADAGVTEETDLERETTLDDLEGLAYHALGAGLQELAWRLFHTRIVEKDWTPHGYHRDERICRAIAAGEPDASIEPNDDLLKTLPLDLSQVWGAALTRLGRLERAESCLYFVSERTEDPGPYLRLYEVWLHRGRIDRVRRSVDAWVDSLVNRVASDDYDFIHPIATLLDELAQVRGYARALAGAWDSRWRGVEFISRYVRAPAAVTERPLTGIPGIRYARFLLRFGLTSDAKAAADIQEQYARREHVENDRTAAFWMQFKLLRAEMALADGQAAEALELQQQGHEWAATRDANDVLCLAHLIRARIELAGAPSRKSLAAAIRWANEGIRLARSCGFSLLHIDLLIVRAQAELKSGRPDNADTDLSLAIAGTIVRPEDAAADRLLPASHSACMYAWGLIEGEHWHGVTCLQQAAQQLGRAAFEAAERSNLPDAVQEKIAEGLDLLQSALDRAQLVGEMGPDTADLGAATRAVLAQVENGRLTDDPLQDIDKDTPPAEPPEGPVSHPAFDVFLSYNNRDKDLVRDIAGRLTQHGIKVWFDESEIRPGEIFARSLGDIIEATRAAAVFLGASGTGPWQDEEIFACIRQSVSNGQTVIPVLLPNVVDDPKVPTFLEFRSRVDLRTPEGFDRLLWAIRGTKPASLAMPH